MSIIRVKKNSNYTVMSNYHLQDKKLSLKAKGLMSFMLSLPENWDYSIDGLSKIVSDGVTSIRSALKELENNNYLKRVKIFNQKGKIIDWQYELYENPLVENPLVENPLVENPLVENQTQLNTNIYNTNILNTNILNTNKNKEEEEQPKKEIETFDTIINSMCQNNKLKEALYDFIKMRKSIKKPLTNRALKNIINKVKKLSNGKGNQAIEILDQSITNCWQDVYELKNKTDTEKRDIYKGITVL